MSNFCTVQGTHIEWNQWHPLWLSVGLSRDAQHSPATPFIAHHQLQLQSVESLQDDEGRAVIQFPGSEAHGFRDFRIVENDLTLTVGSRKSFVCVQPI